MMQTEVLSSFGKHYGVSADQAKPALLAASSTKERMQIMGQYLFDVPDSMFRLSKGFLSETGKLTNNST